MGVDFQSMPVPLLRPLALVALVLLGAAPVSLTAQALVLDEGTFSLSMNGERIGREDFSLRAARGTGGGYIGQGNLLHGEQRRTVVLTVDSTGAPLRFQLDTRELGKVTASVAGQQERQIWSARIVRGGVESARESRLPPDTFIAELGVIHQLWFVLRFGEGRPLTLLSPSGPTQVRVMVEEQAPDRVALGLREFVARRWVLRRLEDGVVLWELWTDSAGRLLKAANRVSALEALRDDPPAETPGATRP
jgi:hypothetical protein